MADNYDELRSITDQFKQNIRDANDALKQTKSIVNESLKPFESLLDIAEKLNDHKKGENELSSKQLQDLSKRVAKEKENLANSQRALSTRLTQLTAEKTKQEQILAANHGNSKAYRDARKALSEVTDEIRQNQMAQSDLAGQIQDTDREVEKLEKSLKNAAAQAKLIEVGKGIGNQLDKISTPLDGMLNPLQLINTLIRFIFGTIVDVDAQLGKAAKSMNMTYQEAKNSRLEMSKMANASGDLLLNSKDLEETLIGVNESLGSAVKFEELTPALKEDVAFLSKMSHYAGLTAEEANDIAKLTLSTGQGAEKFTKELMGQVKISGIQKGIMLNEKTALKEISKTSAAIQMSFHGSAKGLADAYAKSKALGTSLDKVNDIAGSLLNFEESIEAELSAELLTGKDLNLEKARTAALNNDLATVAEEIAKHTGGTAGFAKMNRIQQESLAKAVGMTREELAASLKEQEALKNIGVASVEAAKEKYDKLRETMTAEEALKALGDEQLAKQFEQANIQEKLGAAQLKMADETMPDILKALGSINANFDSMFKKVKDVIDKLGGMKTILVIIGGIIALKMVKGIWEFAAGASKAIKAAKALAAAEKVGGIMAIIKGAWESLGPIPFVGAALATAAVGAGVGYLLSQFVFTGDDIVSPAPGGSGYGKRTLFGPEGAIQLNNKDTIVAGTDLFKADDMVSSPAGSVQINQSPDNSKDIAELKGAIMALAARPVDVAIDGVKVIEATTGAQPNTQGVESAKNSYRIQ